MFFSLKRGLATALAGLAVLSTSACATEQVSASPTPVAFKACMISSREGFSDSGINAEAYYGLLQSEAQFGPQVSVVQMGQNATIDDFTAGLKKLVKRECNLIFGVGPQLVAPIRQVATTYPNVNFALLDAAMSKGNGGELNMANVKNLEFDTTQAAFLAGYLSASKAAGSSIGVVGGARNASNYATLWAFRSGVLYFDQKHDKNTVVIGAIGEAPETWNFAGKASTKQELHDRVSAMVNAGADVIVPIGITGSTIATVIGAYPQVKMVGSTVDWWAQGIYAGQKTQILASIVKRISNTVVVAVGSAVAGNFVGGSGGAWLGTIASGDVWLSAQHEVDYGIGMQAELDSIRADLQNGKLEIPLLSN
jgi:basic membrane protein A